ncbi:MAG TPA: phytoene desaturase family protein [Mycobacteriales bacterium]|nr:phytoene desaturase family protein [Mycobacteriales bacterium]
MRTVAGRTDRVVIVGAGLGGLSAALRLVGAGRDVIVVDRADQPGGRAGRLDLGGCRFDTGPTVLTMPSLLREALACVDEELDDWLDLRPVDPAYRAFFPDGSHLDVIADVDRMAVQVEEVCGAREASGYRRFASFARDLFELEYATFMNRNLDSPLHLVTPSLARLVALGGFRRMAPKIATFFTDPRLRRIFSFQSLYAGLSPYDALALYCSISYLDTIGGVWFPAGGMHAVPAALADAAQKHGAQLRLGTEVSRVEMRGQRAVAVHTTEGERIAADTIVLNTDLPTTWRLLDRPPRRLQWAPSCVLLLAAVGSEYRGAAHHNLHFGAQWRAPLRELAAGRLMSDPSFLVSIPTATDPALAPDGQSLLTALLLVPNLASKLDWDALSPRIRDELWPRLEQAGYVGVSSAVEVEHVTTPADWARQGLAAGTPFSATHRFRQTGPFRPSNLPLENVVLAGCGTHPGVGIPPVLISGRLAAERIVGAGIR